MKTNKNTKLLEKTLQQKFDKCNEATLFVSQRDMVGGAFIFFALNVKSITVKCNATGNEIPKRHWNEQTKADADKLSSQYKVSKTGWRILISFFVIGISFVLFSVFYAWNKGNKHKQTYRGKTEEEKIRLRKNLDTGDLVKSFSAVYKIETISDSKVTVRKSSIPVSMSSINDLIDEEKYAKNTFTSDIIEINKTSFINIGMVNKKLNDEYGGEPIADILDK